MTKDKRHINNSIYIYHLYIQNNYLCTAVGWLGTGDYDIIVEICLFRVVCRDFSTFEALNVECRKCLKCRKNRDKSQEKDKIQGKVIVSLPILTHLMVHRYFCVQLLKFQTFQPGH